MRLSEIADSATIAVRRDGDFQNLGFIPDSQEHMLVFLESARHRAALVSNQSIRVVLTTQELAAGIQRDLALGVCVDPRLAFAKLHNELARRGFYWEQFTTLVSPLATVHPASWVAERNVRIGAHSRVDPHATILERCTLGTGAVIGAGAVLGGVGFQTVRSHRSMLEMEHAGGLVVRDRVHILPGAVIATGLFRQSTVISSDARIGSQAFVSHGVQIGDRAFIGHGAIINGNVTIGDDAWIGPGAVIANNLTIGERAFVSLGAAVIRDVPAGSHVSGNFAASHRQALRLLASMESGSQAR